MVHDTLVFMRVFFVPVDSDSGDIDPRRLGFGLFADLSGARHHHGMLTVANFKFCTMLALARLVPFVLGVALVTVTNATTPEGIKWLKEKAAEEGVHSTGSGLLYKVCTDDMYCSPHPRCD
jgi:hypothetical protein